MDDLQLARFPHIRLKLFLRQTPQPEPAEEEIETDEFDEELGDIEDFEEESAPVHLNDERREALVNLAAQLLELREMLRKKKNEDRNSFERNA